MFLAGKQCLPVSAAKILCIFKTPLGFASPINMNGVQTVKSCFKIDITNLQYYCVFLLESVILNFTIYCIAFYIH